MADRLCNGFISHELHWLDYSLGQSMVSTSVLLGRGKNSAEQSPSSSPSTVKAPLSNHPPKNPSNPSTLRMLDGVLRLATVPVIAPMERIYLLVQCQNEMLKSGRLSSPYVGMKDCFFRTIKNEGVASLWRGSSVYFARFVASEALIFSHEKYFSRILGYDKHVKYDSRISIYKRLVADTIPIALILYPLDYARTRLATDVKNAGAIHFSLDSAAGKALWNQTGRRQFNGLFDVCLKTVKSDGFLGLYRGFSLRWLGGMSYAVTASEIEEFHRIERQKQDRRTTLLASMFPTFLVWSLRVAHYPAFSVSRRMMMTSGEAEKYKGVTDAFCQIIKHEGVSSLYKGVTAYAIVIGAKSATFALVFSATYALVKSI